MGTKINSKRHNEPKKNLEGRASQRLLLSTGFFVLAIFTAVALAVAAFLLSGRTPDLSRCSEGVVLYDRYDQPVVLLKADRILLPVQLSQISPHLRQAIVAAEDKNYYSHHGVDPLGILRALLADAESHRMLQGGSTITQQLVKNLYFEGKKRDLGVKLREAVMALQIDCRYSKEQILEAYLNNVYFGSGAYGAEEAAQRYFGKGAASLSLAESAYLSGLVNAPSVLSVHQQEALARAHAILDNMARYGMVSQGACDAAKNEKLKVMMLATPVDKCLYYLLEVRRQLELRFLPSLLYQTGVRAYTNLDPVAQALASDAITSGIRNAPRGVSQGALISISVADGGVIAIVGGAGSFEKSPWNRALSPHTAGSAFKPFVYLAGLLSGMVRPDSIIEDAPLAVPVGNSGQAYEPKNFDGKFLGPLTVRKALALSRNTCAVRVGASVGPEAIVAVAHAAGINSNLEPTLALSLGASAVSPVDMAVAYATLARGGVRIAPVWLRKVTSPDGRILFDVGVGVDEMVQRRKVFEVEPVAELVDALEDVVEKGTAKQARLCGRPVAGKTGTADGARDIWFVGFTPDMVTAVWGGNDQDLAIAGKQVTGGAIMAGIWQKYMHAYYGQVPTPVGHFPKPATPFIQEAEPLHCLPQPAGIFQKYEDAASPSPAPPISKQSPAAPRQELPDRDNKKEQTSKHKGGVGKFFKKLFKWF